MGITAGYHRCFSHKAYKASSALQLGLILAGTAALQGSVKWWSLLHRAHHRFTDTDDDPYNARRGFWFAHMG
jgi:stearoyl-CoA desaturase (delta-9 desaturase)